MYKRILIATDGSDLSQKAVTHGLSLAAQSGATVVALKVVPRYPRSYFEGGMPVDASDVKRIEQQWGDSAQAMVDGVKALTQPAERDAVATFFEDHDIPQATKTLRQILERQRVNTDLRERAQAGRRLRYLVPRAVECYIEQHGLYR